MGICARCGSLSACTQWFRMKALPASSKELCALGIALGLTSECVVAKAVEFQVIVFTQRC